MVLRVGESVPDFTLRSQHGEEISPGLFRGDRHVVLMFFPFAFSGICTGELSQVRDRRADFEAAGAEVLAISCDPVYANRAFADREGFSFAVLSDFWPHGEVARAYGTFDERVGAPNRGTFVVDRAGLLRWNEVRGMGETRDVSDCLHALAGLS